MDNEARGKRLRTGDPGMHPTHRLHNVKAGDASCQLLVSTQDDLYEAKDIAVGANSWQVIGSWDDASIQSLGKMISTRPGIAGDTGFGNTQGAGRTLGSTTGGSSGNPRMGRPQGTT